MKSSARYAIYYTPAADHPLWALGSEWLGRDAYIGENVAQPDVPGIRADDIARLTSGPAHYGFHATMKAPFRLREEHTELALLEDLHAFGAMQQSFHANLKVGVLGQFLALRLKSNLSDMRALHEACVTHFDRFRAPLSYDDIKRRRRASLSPEQDERMLKWGYPYIFEDFRWHMTLSSRVLNDGTRDKLYALLDDMFSSVLRDPLLVDGVALFRQVDRAAPFNIIERVTFSQDTSASEAMPRTVIAAGDRT